MAAAGAGFLFAQAHVNEQAALLAGSEVAIGSNLGNGWRQRLVGHTAIVWLRRWKATGWYYPMVYLLLLITIPGKGYGREVIGWWGGTAV